ncbi:MAG: group II truncated hemoglobin [Candidatus Accumulibacter sp.]|jgi:hemoglobin|uniref:group II truncated hemoglobin n=1 Tax=Candidatus Accumulibacter TaxID=327159 RepID=UPI001AC12DA2|nr:group II truncated hemoglobin [Accumulibacter sp.]MBK8113712.1 group II truncated hemoglobin [Accumulibacter sp.]MBK8386386.1 group II truncated hemoglobin [Accumulibacter sp.]MBN8437619.1 group II truncated hemoglobin [Accumulibacter sp.]
MQQQTPYQLIGGESTLARLCNRFYELMDSVPQFATIRALHPVELQSSQDKLYMFLSGWLGGPDLYVENIGHPMLRRRHLPFAIGESERDQWVACMVLAMESVGIEEPLREQLMLSFFNTADFLRNQQP